MKEFIPRYLISDRDTSNPSPPSPMNIFVAYHDEVCHAATRHFYQNTIKAGAADLEVENLWCGFERLGHPQTYFNVRAAAARADVLVIAVRIERPYPVQLQFWTEGWLRQRKHLEGALVALMVGQRDSAGHTSLSQRHWRLSQYFRYAAADANMDYFGHKYFLANTRESQDC